MIQLKNGEWVSLAGPGYTIEVTQYSNKGPLFVIKSPDGEEIGRGRFCLDGERWRVEQDAKVARPETRRSGPSCPKCRADSDSLEPIMYEDIDSIPGEAWEDHERGWGIVRQIAPKRGQIKRTHCRNCRHEF